MRDETGARRFPTTRWTLIQSARGSPQTKRAALGELLTDYWRPLYFFVRRRGLSPEAAEDAVQGFCLQLLTRDIIDHLDPGRGRLRSYLRTAIKHYLANEYEKRTAQKRGGDLVQIPFDFEVAESALSQAPQSPEVAYEQEWALGVMRRALAQLEAEFRSGARKGPFEVVCAFFSLDGQPSYQEVARANAMTIPQLKAFLHRARVRFRELVASIVADTVDEAPATATPDHSGVSGAASRIGATDTVGKIDTAASVETSKLITALAGGTG